MKHYIEFISRINLCLDKAINDYYFHPALATIASNRIRSGLLTDFRSEVNDFELPIFHVPNPRHKFQTMLDTSHAKDGDTLLDETYKNSFSLHGASIEQLFILDGEMEIGNDNPFLQIRNAIKVTEALSKRDRLNVYPAPFSSRVYNDASISYKINLFKGTDFGKSNAAFDWLEQARGHLKHYNGFNESSNYITDLRIDGDSMDTKVSIIRNPGNDYALHLEVQHRPHSQKSIFDNKSEGVLKTFELIYKLANKC